MESDKQYHALIFHNLSCGIYVHVLCEIEIVFSVFSFNYVHNFVKRFVSV